jgi:hypothetical protein
VTESGKAEAGRGERAIFDVESGGHMWRLWAQRLDRSTSWRSCTAEDIALAGFVPASSLAAAKLDLANACDVGRRLEARLTATLEARDGSQAALVVALRKKREAEESVVAWIKEADRLNAYANSVETRLASERAAREHLDGELERALAAAAHTIGELQESIADVADSFDQNGKHGIADQLRQFLPTEAPAPATTPSTPAPPSIAARLDEDGDWVDAETHAIRGVTHWALLPPLPKPEGSK